MASSRRLSSPQMYTIGWITALDKELTAAQAMLDEEHRKPENFRKNTRDTNSYVWGRVGDHNVVIACLAAGKYGTVSAATTASSMISSLPHLRFGLMVGIGAGIPRLEDKIDIRLGDVVVSQPTGTSPGVVQYDLGKVQNNNQFKRVGCLAPPPEVLLNGLAVLKAKRRLRGPRAREILDDMLQRHPLLAQAEPDDAAFVHQGAENDRLFRASARHIQPPDQYSAVLSTAAFSQDASFTTARTNNRIEDADLQVSQIRACAHCDPQQEIERRERPSSDPMVHYGVIASGNLVVKDGISRDEISRHLGDECICFEMEAAGLMDHFPCLVIRGVCDYADTHKNDRWQNYAAATAAAFAKELLDVIDSDDVEGALRVDEIMEQLQEKVSLVQEGVSEIRSATKDVQHSQHFQQVMKWLSAPDPSTNDNKALQQRHANTGQWLLDSEQYSRWKKTPNSSLWLHGIPGCGKTILSSVVVNNLRHTESYFEYLYFYFDFTDTSKQSLEKALRSLIAQLYQKRQDVQTFLNSLYSSCQNGSHQPSTDSLSTVFIKMAQQVGKVWIVLDALDECQTRTGRGSEGLLRWIESILDSKPTNIHLLVTSRPEHDISIALERRITDIISLESDLVMEDINVYIHAKVTGAGGLERWRERKEIQNQIEKHLREKANGMFRWVACQIDELEKCLDPRTLRETLALLPKDLDGTYARILKRIPPEFIQNATRILQFLAYSQRPLRIEEARDAIAVAPRATPSFNPQDRMPVPEEISRYCSSLVVLVTRGKGDGENGVKELQLAHFSVKEYLISDRVEGKSSADFKEPLARAIITEVCLSYLLELNGRLSLANIKQSFPLAQYAARYWSRHAVLAEDTKVLQLIQAFCLQKDAMKLCRRLYDIHRPWDEEPDGLQEDETPDLYHMAHEGVVCAVKELLKNGADVNTQGGYYGNALYAASSRGHIEIVQVLINNKADVNAQGGEYSNALQAASSGGHIEIVQILINNKADVNAPGGYYGNALYAASSKGYIEIIQILLDNKADVNAQGGYYRNALYAASSRGHTEIVQILVDNKADVNAQSGYYGNALYAASSGGHTEIVQILVENKADVNAQGGEYSNALQAASSRGHIEIVQILINNKADVNAQGGEYSNALQAASSGGHIEIVQILINNKADVNAQGGYYGNALYAASSKGYIEIIQILLDNKADVNAQGGYYRNALYAASSRGHTEIVQILVDNKADVNAQSGYYGNALYAASSEGHTEIVQILVDNKADVNAQGGGYRNALQAASYRGHTEIVQILIDNKADVNTQGGYYGNALYAASSRGHIEIVQVLINNKADVNAQGGEYSNALQAASSGGHIEIVQILINNKADVNAQGGYYGNALYAASSKGYIEIIQILLDNKADVNA